MHVLYQPPAKSIFVAILAEDGVTSGGDLERSTSGKSAAEEHRDGILSAVSVLVTPAPAVFLHNAMCTAWIRRLRACLAKMTMSACTR